MEGVIRRVLIRGFFDSMILRKSVKKILSVYFNFSYHVPPPNSVVKIDDMATDRTPGHKRIKRAETGRDDWKMKATLRREENEKLTHELESKKTAC